MTTRITINDEALKSLIRNSTASGLARAAQQYHTDLRMALNESNPGVKVPVKRSSPGGNKKTRTVYPNASKPPNPPRKRTGNLQQSVVRELDKAIPAARIGVTKAGIYGLYHELGAGHLPRRIWMMSTLERRAAAYGQLLAPVESEST